MRKISHLLLLLQASLSSLAAPSPSQTTSTSPPAFTYNSNTFLLNGAPFQIIGGQMDPQRIPPQYWRSRLRTARSMGLNTIFPYIFWDRLEPSPNHYTFSDPSNDIATYIRLAHEEGLKVVLRPGPYICGEHDFGGFPPWLTQIPGLVVRDYNEEYLNASKKYLTRLADELHDLQISEGGPILMVQVENEYGSFGENHEYIAALRDILKDLFQVPLYTNDGGVQFTLDGGSIPGVLAEIDGDPSSGFIARDQYITDPSMLGPLLDGEYYTYAPDQWGSQNPHNTTTGNPDAVQQFVKDIEYTLGNKSASISFYMVHGGTNFGFQNGALWQNRTTVFTSSYDYSAPIDEAGRTGELFQIMKEAIGKYLPEGEILPEVPENVAMMSIPEFELKPMAGLFETCGEKVEKEFPVPMEALGQWYGYIAYEHVVEETVSGVVRPGDRARDRVLVYVNGVKVGVIDSQYQHPREISVDLKEGDRLSLLVENLGRVDYYSRGNMYEDRLRQPNKGIVGNVTVGGEELHGWDICNFPLEQLPSKTGEVKGGPAFYSGTFEIANGLEDASDAALDTYLAVPNGFKGQVFVNGFNLGRYWIVGPQQSLYLPGTLLKREGPNEVVVLELEPELVNGTMVARGLSEREWFNRPDVDCEDCV